jgi:hypothetical protein
MHKTCYSPTCRAAHKIKNNHYKSYEPSCRAKKNTRIPIRYIPKRLNKKDSKLLHKELKKSRKLYKKGLYYTRKKLNTFKSKPSNHITRARKLYNMKNIIPSTELSKKTGCSLNALKKIVNKGEGAYFSSGSRPNQTAQSWGYARLASAITGGKASAVDFSILKLGCTKNSKALRLASRSKHFNRGTRRVPKVKL